jgi:hypothetical protein
VVVLVEVTLVPLPQQMVVLVLVEPDIHLHNATAQVQHKPIVTE